MNVNYNAYVLPPWSNSSAWDTEQYYSTIGSADFDGDGLQEIYSCSDDGLDVWKYIPDFGTWLPVDDSDTPIFTNHNGWDQPLWYDTVGTADLDGDGDQEIYGRSSQGIVAYDALVTYYPKKISEGIESWTWEKMEPGPSWLDEDWYWPQYYRTIQAADIDGDGADELVGRFEQGLLVYKYQPDDGGWQQLATLTDLSDKQGFDLAPYYETLQFADITGNGRQELLIRASSGMYAFSYQPQETTKWVQLEISNAPFGDPGWWQSPYYGTIQCADVNGDGRAELLGRSSDGLETYRYDLSSSQWKPYKVLADVSDRWGFNADQYAGTMRTADVDGDGAAEFMVRSGSGLSTYDLDADSGSWIRKASDLLEISDDMGWDQPQYYSTLQFANLDGDSAGSAEMLIRGGTGVRSYKISQAGSWSRTETSYPDFTADADSEEAKAYNSILEQFVQDGPLNEGQDLRDLYSQIDENVWSTYLADLNNMTQPSGVSDTAWQTVIGQLRLELNALSKVNQHFTGDMLNAIRDLSEPYSRTLSNVEGLVEAKNSDTVSYLAGLFAKMAIEAGLDMWEPEGSITAKVGWSLLSAGVSGLLDGLEVYESSESKVEMAFEDLGTQMDSWLADNLTRLTESYTDLTSTWGMTQAQMRMTNQWPSGWDSGNMIKAMNREYEISLFKALMPVKFQLYHATNAGQEDISNYFPYNWVEKPPEGTYMTVKNSDGTYDHYVVAHDNGVSYVYPTTKAMNAIWGVGTRREVSKNVLFFCRAGWNFTEITEDEHGE